YVAEETEVDLPLFAVVEQESGVRDVLEWLCLLLLLFDLAGDEFAAAAVRHPDAGVVIAPGFSEEAWRRTRRSCEGYPCGRVGGTVDAFACGRRARNGRLRHLGGLRRRLR